MEHYRMSEHLEQKSPEWIDNPLFHSMLIQLHQHKNISLDILNEEEMASLDDLSRVIVEYSVESGIHHVTQFVHFDVLSGEGISLPHYQL